MAVVLALFVLPPLYFLVHASIHTWAGFEVDALSLDNFRAIASQEATAMLLANSLIYSVGSSGIAILLGTALAWAVERTDTPFKTLVYIASFMGLAIPGVVNNIGWILLLGPEAGILNRALSLLLGASAPVFNIYSMAGMILVESLSWTPVVFLLMATPFKSMDPSLEEAAALSGASTGTTLRRVTLPLALPSILSALILSFVRTLESFETPALLGIPSGVRVLTTEIYLQIRSGLAPQYGVSSAYSVLLMVMVAGLLLVYNRQTAASQRFATVTGKGFRPRQIHLGTWRYVMGCVCLALPLLVALPLGAMIWASVLPYYRVPSIEALSLLSLDNYITALNSPRIISSVFNTVVVGFFSSSVVILLTLVAAWLIVRTDVVGRSLLDQLASIPLIIPGIVAGIAVLRTYINSPLDIYGTVWILVAAYVMRYMPYGMRYTHAGIVQIHKDLEESADVSGASWIRRLHRIVIPLVLPALAGGWIYVFLISSSQLSIPLLLSGADNEVVAVSIYGLWQNGQITVLSAFSVLVTGVVIGLGYLFFRISRRYGL